jgi:hypothetical protein
MKPFLMGTETEYAVSGAGRDGPMPAEEVYSLLNDAIRKERLYLPDVNGGRALYLQHGGRFYLDSGGHPELATPEVHTPAQVAAYDKAGERLLDLARARAVRDRPDVHITLAKNNIHAIFPERAVWGCHESHTCWAPHDRVAPQLIPHLVSRLVYAGAGCLSARPNGTGFELSQRARHLVQAVGTETTSNRAIFCTRVRKATDFSRDGWTRIHLICKDSQRAPFGIYLTFGTTALLILLINEGHEVGKGLALAEPVKAAQAVSLDPWLNARVPLADGRSLTALQIQEAYLAECERLVPRAGLPGWTRDVLGHWRRTLEDLGEDPLRLANRLDPYCKLLIFTHELRRANYQWADLLDGLRALERLRATFPDVVVRAVLAENPRDLTGEARARFTDALAVAREGQSGGFLDRFRFALRLQALELKYHEVGALYDQLAAAGQLDPVVITREDLERATLEPPPGGRAAVRGNCIKEKREAGWVCDWRYLYHGPTQTFVDLRDPFAGTYRALKRDQFPDGARPDLEAFEMLRWLSGR